MAKSKKSAKPKASTTPTFQFGETVLGRPQWRLVERLGKGGFGEVWKVKHDATSTIEAVKFCVGVGRKAGIANEAATLKALQANLPKHPNIVTMTAAQLDADPLWVAFEFVPGTPLDAHLRERGALNSDEAQRLFTAICHGVAAAHAAGIVHGDLKPSNIIIATDGTPKITDFGLGKVLADDSADDVQHSGTVTVRHFGTPIYLSPERRRNGTPSAADDVYALGVILFQMLAGDTTLDAQYTAETLAEMKRQPSPRLREVIDRCLTHPRHRPSIRGVLDHLSAPTPTPISTLTPAVSEAAKRVAAKVAAIFVCAVVVAASLGYCHIVRPAQMQAADEADFTAAMQFVDDPLKPWADRVGRLDVYLAGTEWYGTPRHRDAAVHRRATLIAAWHRAEFDAAMHRAQDEHVAVAERITALERFLALDVANYDANRRLSAQGCRTSLEKFGRISS